MVFFPFLKHSVSGGACWATEATPYSILRTFLMRRKARVNLCSVPCTKGVREPRSSPSPSVSRSPPLPCSLNATNVFFTQLCAGLCVQACVAFPPSIASSHNTHTKTHTHLPASGLGQHCSCCCCCCCYFVGNCPRYAATSHVGTLCRHISVEVWSKSY